MIYFKCVSSERMSKRASERAREPAAHRTAIRPTFVLSNVSYSLCSSQKAHLSARGATGCLLSRSNGSRFRPLPSLRALSHETPSRNCANFAASGNFARNTMREEENRMRDHVFWRSRMSSFEFRSPTQSVGCGGMSLQVPSVS